MFREMCYLHYSEVHIIPVLILNGSGLKVHLGAWKYTFYVIVNFGKLFVNVILHFRNVYYVTVGNEQR